MVYERLPCRIHHTRIELPQYSNFEDTSMIIVTRRTHTALLATCKTIHEDAKDTIRKRLDWILNTSAKIVLQRSCRVELVEKMFMTLAQHFKALLGIPTCRFDSTPNLQDRGIGRVPTGVQVETYKRLDTLKDRCWPQAAT